MSNRAMMGLVCILALYFAFGRPALPPAPPTPTAEAARTSPGSASPMSAASLTTVDVKNSRTLHQVKVLRADPDGVVVSSAEGTFKIWDRQITPEVSARLKRQAPPPTPTPVPWSTPCTPRPVKK